ncbi:MAG: hypothetical protein M1528_02255, partial [Candidatus Marsarchaeota archaeon]|nr:hypothetical protein [Candidatus Marsarchaeota archaeon]
MLKYGNGEVYSTDQSTIDTLKDGFIGSMKEGRLVLEPEEALYLMDVRKASCNAAERGSVITFNELASSMSSADKLISRYFTYKDWRDRGLI